jgi:hypothetical protein
MAVKVMVMSFSGSFIQRPERWMKNPVQPAIPDKDLEIPVDRGLIERFDELASVFEDLIHCQGPVVL